MKFQPKPKSAILEKLNKTWRSKHGRRTKNIWKSTEIKEACSTWC